MIPIVGPVLLASVVILSCPLKSRDWFSDVALKCFLSCVGLTPLASVALALGLCLLES